MLVHADDLHAEASRVVDQHPAAFGQDRRRWRCPRTPPGPRRCGRRSGVGRPVLPAPTAARGARAWLAARPPWSCPAATMDCAARAPVAAHGHQQRRGSPPERFVRQLAGDAVPRRPLAAAPGGTAARRRSVHHAAHASTAFRSRCCPTTTRPSSSRRQNAVRLGRAKAVASATSRRFPGGRRRNLHPWKTSTSTPASTPGATHFGRTWPRLGAGAGPAEPSSGGGGGHHLGTAVANLILR